MHRHNADISATEIAKTLVKLTLVPCIEATAEPSL